MTISPAWKVAIGSLILGMSDSVLTAFIAWYTIPDMAEHKGAMGTFMLVNAAKTVLAWLKSSPLAKEVQAQS